MSQYTRIDGIDTFETIEQKPQISEGISQGDSELLQEQIEVTMSDSSKKTLLFILCAIIVVIIVIAFIIILVIFFTAGESRFSLL